MATLIADSGSSKTHWTTDGADSMVVSTQGLNPRQTVESDFHAAVEEMLRQLPVATEAMEVYFYGAGCGTEAMRHRVETWLKSHFPHATLHIHTDLIGACRAVCHHRRGSVGILGTGSNLCHYTGHDIDHSCPSVGYLLGDEGSGNHIGRNLLKDYLEGFMPKVLSDRFHEFCPLTHDQFLTQLYQRPYPNRYLATLTPFAAQWRDDPYIADLLARCFDAFMVQVRRHGLPADEPLHIVGGITRSFAAELYAAAERQGLQTGILMPDPIEGLRSYHHSE